MPLTLNTAKTAIFELSLLVDRFYFRKPLLYLPCIVVIRVVSDDFLLLTLRVKKGKKQRNMIHLAIRHSKTL